MIELNPGVREMDWKFQPANHMVGTPGKQPPSLGVVQSYLIKKTKESYILGNSKSFRSSVPRTVDEVYIVIIINHSITEPQLVQSVF